MSRHLVQMTCLITISNIHVYILGFMLSNSSQVSTSTLGIRLANPIVCLQIIITYTMWREATEVVMILVPALPFGV